MMRNPMVIVVNLSAVFFCTLAASGSEPAVKAVKPRMVPRPLPCEPSAMKGAEEHLFRKPPNGGASAGRSGLTQPEEKARIGVIRRGDGDVHLTGRAEVGFVGLDGLKSDSVGVLGQSALRPVSPSRIRVIPRAELKPDTGVAVTAQQLP
jgi:hypothetical protein